MKDTSDAWPNRLLDNTLTACARFREKLRDARDSSRLTEVSYADVIHRPKTRKIARQGDGNRSTDVKLSVLSIKAGDCGNS